MRKKKKSTEREEGKRLADSGEEDKREGREKYLNAQQGAFERDYSHKSINNSQPGRTLASHCPRPTWEQHLAYIIPPSHIKEPWSPRATIYYLSRFWWLVPSRNNAPNVPKVGVFGRHRSTVFKGENGPPVPATINKSAPVLRTGNPADHRIMLNTHQWYHLLIICVRSQPTSYHDTLFRILLFILRCARSREILLEEDVEKIVARFKASSRFRESSWLEKIQVWERTPFSGNWRQVAWITWVWLGQWEW